jgi:membrane protein implicated in regulation of membrane protease activity
MSDWFVWNFGTILLFAAIGCMTWMVCQTGEVKAKVKSPVLMGLAGSLLGALDIGLASVVSAAVYLLFLYIFRYWYVKLKGHEFEGFEIEEDMKDDNKKQNNDWG